MATKGRDTPPPCCVKSASGAGGQTRRPFRSSRAPRVIITQPTALDARVKPVHCESERAEPVPI